MTITLDVLVWGTLIQSDAYDDGPVQSDLHVAVWIFSRIRCNIKFARALCPGKAKTKGERTRNNIATRS